MKFQELTSSEQILLFSVGFGTILLTGIVILCIIWKKCWIHELIWGNGKKKKQSEDIICIRYPPDIFPASIGVYTEQITQSPEDELLRIFSSPVKRDSTYSSMSDNSSSRASAYELANSPQLSTPDSEVSDSGKQLLSNAGGTKNNGSSEDGDQIHKKPFFTFGLKYDDENGLVHIEFMECRNMPGREYLPNQPADLFFTVEVEPKKAKRRESASNGNSVVRYRFVTKTVRGISDISDFSEQFLAQIVKGKLKDYDIRFTAFDQDRFGNPTELGSTSLTFQDFRDFAEQKLILSCSLKDPIIKRGSILVGLCYLPTAERISVNIMKVANLNPYYSHGTISKHSICYVRVFLLRGDTGKVIKRKKTTYQKLGQTSDSPIFNETLVFDMPPQELLHTVLLVMVCVTDKIISSPSPTNTKRHSTPEQPTPSTLKSLLFASSGSTHHHRHSVDTSAFSPQTPSTLSVDSSISADSSRRSSLNVPEPSDASSSSSSRSKDQVVGKLGFSYQTRNTGAKAHWDKMIRTPRTISSDWHPLH